MIEAVGASLLYLPPLQSRPQPDRDGLLQAESSPAKSRRAIHPTLWDAVGRLIDFVTPNEAANFFAAAGYEPD